jgi:transcriptional regulator with GAF, ATPase, and Fis domain
MHRRNISSLIYRAVVSIISPTETHREGDAAVLTTKSDENRNTTEQAFDFSGIIGHDRGMCGVVECVKRVLGIPINVLIRGESGTGKELIARALHDADPRRSNRPFVAINAAAIPEQLVEAELFGHSKGAFSGAHTAREGCFAEANGGTLFLDEIGEMPLSLQPKLLRALELKVIRRLGDSRETRLDLRIVAATNMQLRTAMVEQRFRPDLFFRLAEYEIVLPPLRDRAADIPLLADHFLNSYRTPYGRPGVRCFSPEAVAWMTRNPWRSNNVRELSAAIKRAILNCSGSVIGIEHLLDMHPAPRRRQADDIDGEQMRAALVGCQGNIAAAARLLGISRSTLHDRLKRCGIRPLESPVA